MTKWLPGELELRKNEAGNARIDRLCRRVLPATSLSRRRFSWPRSFLFHSASHRSFAILLPYHPNGKITVGLQKRARYGCEARPTINSGKILTRVALRQPHSQRKLFVSRRTLSVCASANASALDQRSIRDQVNGRRTILIWWWGSFRGITQLAAMSTVAVCSADGPNRFDCWTHYW